MLFLNLTGRLGNQMFQYAFARKLKCQRGNEDTLCFSFKDVLVRHCDDNDGFEDSLKYFRVDEYVTDNVKLCQKYGTIVQQLALSCFLLLGKVGDGIKWKHFLDKRGIIFSREDQNDTLIRDWGVKNVFLFGKFENPSYFDDIKELLINEFTPKLPVLVQNERLLGIINNTNSVCVTIRRGDFLSNKYVKDFYVCDKHFFLKGIEIIKQKVINPVFIFFSDDITWVKENFKLDGEVYYESGNDPVWEKLRLMYSCKHFIISNSTFSWWAQYLSRNKEKIVVSPDKWFANEKWRSFLLDEDFLKIKI